jgi:hypothetical protein
MVKILSCAIATLTKIPEEVNSNSSVKIIKNSKNMSKYNIHSLILLKKLLASGLSLRLSGKTVKYAPNTSFVLLKQAQSRNIETSINCLMVSVDF